MSFDFENAYQLTTSDGEVKEISQNGTTVWERAISTPAPQNTNFAPTRSGNALGVAITGKSQQGAGLPAGYTQLEYIQSSGTQYIDTGIVPTSVIKFHLVTTCLNLGSWYIMQARDNSSSPILGITGSQSGATIIAAYRGVNTTSDVARTIDHKYEVTYDVGASSGTFVVTDITSSITSTKVMTLGSDAIPTSNIGLFGNVGARNRVSGKIHEAQIWTNGTLVRDFVPCKNSSNVVGMYDLVSGQFFTNAGTGSFTAGAEVKPTPTNPIEVKGVGRSVLPSGYKQLEYIQTALGSSYSIGTNITAQETDKIIVDANIDAFSVSGDKYLIAASNSWVDIAGYGNTWFIRFGSSGSAQATTSGGVGQRNIYELYKQHFDINGTTIATPTYSSIGGSWYIFASSSSLQGVPCKMYSYKIINTNTNEVRFSGIPAKNSSNVVGMYDLVSNTFFTNAGSGSFTAGPEVAYCTLPITVGSTTYNPTIATPLQKVGTYADSISGSVLTRGVGVKVFDGTEGWQTGQAYADGTYRTFLTMSFPEVDSAILCSHFEQGIFSRRNEATQGDKVYVNITSIQIRSSQFSSPETAKAFLAAQYAAGTPVTVYYPLATPTTEAFTQPTIPLTKATTYQWELDTEISPTTSSLNYLGKEGA